MPFLLQKAENFRLLKAHVHATTTARKIFFFLNDLIILESAVDDLAITEYLS